MDTVTSTQLGLDLCTKLIREREFHPDIHAGVQTWSEAAIEHVNQRKTIIHTFVSCSRSFGSSRISLKL